MNRTIRSLAKPGLAALVLLGAAAPQAFSAKSGLCGPGPIDCTHTPMSGAITATSAGVLIRVNADTTASVRYRSSKTTGWKSTSTLALGVATDHSGSFMLPNLTAATTYEYEIGLVQSTGKTSWGEPVYFKTPAAAPATVSFSVLSDFVNELVSSPALRQAATMPNDFMLVIGDLDHRNPGADSKGNALPTGDTTALAQMRTMHQDLRSTTTPIGIDFNYALFGGSTAKKPQIPLYYAWDDHDFCNNNTGSECPTSAFAYQAYRENYLWMADSGMNGAGGASCPQGDYQRIDLGALGEVYMLDARSNRIEKSKDVTATTLLGSCQKNWLFTRLQASKALWKIVMTPVTFNPGTKQWDAWGHFPSEHDEVVNFVKTNNIKNVILLSGDVHTGGAYDDGTHAGLREFSVPHANMASNTVDTYCLVAQKSAGNLPTVKDQPGTWTVGQMWSPNTGATPSKCLGQTLSDGVTLDGALPVPPYPLAGLDQAGFAHIDLSSNQATVQIIGYDGVPRVGVVANGNAAPISQTFKPE